MFCFVFLVLFFFSLSPHIELTIIQTLFLTLAIITSENYMLQTIGKKYIAIKHQNMQENTLSEKIFFEEISALDLFLCALQMS